MDNPYNDLIRRYCSGAISRQEERDLFDWVRQSEENALMFKEAERQWRKDHSGSIAAKFAVEKARTRIRHTYMLLAGGVAAAAAAVLLLVLLLPQMGGAKDPRSIILNSSDAVCIKVPMSSITEITLPDGTKAWLNAGTELRYAQTFNSKDRNIYLTGEGYFEVAHNKMLPFNVYTNSCKVTALGTKFNVFAYEGEQRTFAALLEGCISFEAGEESVVLAPGMIASYENSEISTASVEAEQYTSWINGEIKYDEISLPEFLNRLSRLYIKEISYEKNILSARKFRAAFSQTENFDDILKVISNLLPVKVKTSNGKYIVTETTE